MNVKMGKFKSFALALVPEHVQKEILKIKRHNIRKQLLLLKRYTKFAKTS